MLLVKEVRRWNELRETTRTRERKERPESARGVEVQELRIAYRHDNAPTKANAQRDEKRKDPISGQAKD